MDYKAEFAKAQAEWNYKSEFAKAQAEWNTPNNKKAAESVTDATATPEALYPEADPATKECRSSKKKKRKSSKKVTKNENENGIEMTQLNPVAASSGGVVGGVTTSPATIAPPSAPAPTVVLTSVIPPQPPASTAVNTGAAVAIPEQAPPKQEQAPPIPTKQPSSRPTPSKSKSKSLNKAKSSKKWPSSTVTVEIHKQQSQKIGIKFAEHKGKVIIGDIDKDGLAYPTELHKGMIVLSINNQRDFLDKERRKGAGKNATQRYVDQIENSSNSVPEGEVIMGIVVQHPLGFIPICIANPTPTTTELGLGFGSATEELKKKKEQQIVVVTSIEPNSPADLQTMLQEGMILRAINHKKCSPTITTKQAFDSIYNGKAVVKMLVQPCNEYSRKAKTELLDTYNKPPPVPKKGDQLPSNGYWVQIRYFGLKDIATLPMKLTLKATAGVHQTKKKKIQSIYVVNGKAYNTKGKYMGEESKYFIKTL